MDPTRQTVFGPEFLDVIARWTLALSAMASLVASAVVRDGWLGVAWLAVCIGDVTMAQLASARAGRAATSATPGIATAALIFGRLVVKGVVLVLAWFAPNRHVFLGAVAGALAYDLVLASVGAVISFTRTRSLKGGG